MEQLLLELDVGSPNIEQLNAISGPPTRSRAARRRSAASRSWPAPRTCSKTFWTRSVAAKWRCARTWWTYSWKRKTCSKPIDAYRASEEPDEAVFERICAVLRQLALEHKDPAAAAQAPAPAPVAAPRRRPRPNPSLPRNRRRPRRRATAPACAARAHHQGVGQGRRGPARGNGQPGSGARQRARQWHADRLGRQHLHA